MLMTQRTDGLHLYLAAQASTLPSLTKVYAVQKQNQQPLKVLLSYHYFKNVDLDAMVEDMRCKPMMFADCGAYSAATQGVTINLVDYANWLKRWAHLLTVSVNLDVIRNAKATRKNQLHMERLGCNVIPVFHTGTDLTILDEMCKRYPYIALGGMVGAEKNVTLRWAATCMERTKEHGTAFHGFGQTTKKNIETLPWYSIDSSSWGSGHRYGNVPVWTGRGFTSVKIGNHASVYKQAAHIRRLGVDPMHLANRSHYHQRHAIHVASASWRKWEELLRARHGGVECKQRTDGLHLYLVDGAASNLVEAGRHITQ